VFVVLDWVAFGDHPLVKNAGNQYAARFPAIENRMPPALHRAQTRTDIIARTAEFREFGELPATPFQIVDITYGLVFAPTDKRVTRDSRQIGFGTSR